MWRTTAMHRGEVAGSLVEDTPPPLPAGVDHDGLQHPEDGVGPLFHRRYQVRIRNASLAPDDLVARISADPNCIAPTEFARFSKVFGIQGRMQVGDEFVVRMPGPWDGPVRVIEITPTSFRLATLVGHLEAGQIAFRALLDGDLLFVIESWARSGDWLCNLLYDRLRIAKEVQLHMWCSVLERIVCLSGGRLTGGVHVHTRRVNSTDHGR